MSGQAAWCLLQLWASFAPKCDVGVVTTCEEGIVSQPLQRYYLRARRINPHVQTAALEVPHLCDEVCLAATCSGGEQRVAFIALEEEEVVVARFWFTFPL